MEIRAPSLHEMTILCSDDMPRSLTEASVTKMGKNLTDGLVLDNKTTVLATVSHKNSRLYD